VNLPEVEKLLSLMPHKEVILLTKRLPRKQLHVFFLRWRHGKRFKEISNALGCPYNTAKANYRHAITNLMGELKNEVNG